MLSRIHQRKEMAHKNRQPKRTKKKLCVISNEIETYILIMFYFPCNGGRLCLMLLLVRLLEEQRTYPEHAVQPVNGSSHQKINHENTRINVSEYNNLGEGNAFRSEVAGDRGQGVPFRGNVNNKPTKASDVNIKFDESALSRCALLFIGALCQQGKRCNCQTSLRFTIFCIPLCRVLWLRCIYCELPQKSSPHPNTFSACSGCRRGAFAEMLIFSWKSL